jgi:hypothetical protein
MTNQATKQIFIKDFYIIFTLYKEVIEFKFILTILNVEMNTIKNIFIFEDILWYI